MINQLDLKTKYMIRYLLQVPSHYTPSHKPNIFLFSTRRGGSTLLSNMIYSQPGFNYIDQPLDFTVRQFNPYRNLFSGYGFETGQIIKLNEKQKASVKSYLDKLLNRNFILNSQWKFWANNYHWSWNRYVVKEVNAKPLMPWFECIYKGKVLVVYQTRHPFATAASLLDTNWGHINGVFLQDGEFVDTYLTSKMRDFAREIALSNSRFENYVLDWCFENFIPLRLWNKSSWTTVSYEYIIQNPQEACLRITSLLNLPEPEKMINTVFQPTRNTSKKSKIIISSIGPKSRLTTWLNNKMISAQELYFASKILDVFEVYLYSAESPYAHPDFDRYLYS